MAETDLFEIMYSAGSIRRLRSDPVPDEVITKVLDAAIRAPSGSNAQSWVFIVVKDAEKRRQLGAVYRKTSGILLKLYEGAQPPAHMDQRKYERFMKAVTHLFEHMGEAPVLLVPCLKTSMWTGASNLPADVKARMAKGAACGFQHLSCSAEHDPRMPPFGLGTVLTTIHAFYEDEVREILKLPANVQTYALMPIGYPQGHHYPVKRKPVAEVACLDHYGNPWPK
jgi:nitroreductase